MKITVNEERRVTPKTVILGICGEVGVRSIEIDAPTVSGAVLYVMRFAVPSGVVYETEINGGSVTVPAAVLAETGCGLMQWVARSSTGQLIAKSETIGYAVMQSVGDETSTLPAPEDTQSAIDRIKEAADEAIGSISGLVPEDGTIQEVIDARTGCFSDYTYASLQRRLNAELGACVRQNAFEQTVSALSIKDMELGETVDELKTKAHTHTNKGVLDGITEDDVIAWDDTVKEVNAARTSSTNSSLTLPSLSARVAYDLGNINSSSELRHSKQQMSIDALLLKEALIRGTVGMSYKKNLLPNTASTATVNGVTFTVNSDGSVTANGTATALTHFYIGEVALNPDMYIFGDINEAASEAGADMMLGYRIDNGAYVDERRLSSSEEIYSVWGIHSWRNGNFEIDRQVVIWISAVIAEGYTANNVIFYPMIRYADVTDDTYEPYIPSLQTQIDNNQISIEENTVSIETNRTDIDENAALTISTLGAPLKKNLLKNTASTATVNGVTFTVNSDGSVTANGTATANVFFEIPIKATLPAKELILTGCPAGGSSSTYMLRADGDIMYATDVGSGATVTAENVASVTKIVIKINNGYTADGLVFSPMLRYADITDSTFEPYTPSLQEQIDELRNQIAAMTTAAATTETEE